MSKLIFFLFPYLFVCIILYCLFLSYTLYLCFSSLLVCRSLRNENLVGRGSTKLVLWHLSMMHFQSTHLNSTFLLFHCFSFVLVLYFPSIYFFQWRIKMLEKEIKKTLCMLFFISLIIVFLLRFCNSVVYVYVIFCWISKIK